MNDSEFLQLAERTLTRIDSALDACEIDIESTLAGTLLTLEFESGSKIVINAQPALQEVWIAARAGGFHFRYDGSTWFDTRNGSELFATLSQHISQQAGTPVMLQAA